jgi:(E)-4-hydroxy-3-methylbut-2-enyl-diphosphate synthase
MNKRVSTRSVAIGTKKIGGQEHILIQSMCNIKTAKAEEVSAQINRCAALGAEIMRVSVLDFEDAAAIKEIKKRISIPLVADIHIDYRLALAALEAGADAIRINPRQYWLARQNSANRGFGQTPPRPNPYRCQFRLARQNNL